MFDTPFWAGLWNPVYTVFFLLLTVAYCVKTSGKNAEKVLFGHNTSYSGLACLCIIISVYIGCRPIVWGAFADSWGYYHSFEYYAQQPLALDLMDKSNKDGLFYYIEILCTRFTTAKGWFIIIALSYNICTLWAACRIFSNNAYAAMLAFFVAFSTFSYATNGIRNGMACSVLLLAISYIITPGKTNLIKALIFGFIATQLHASVTLPALCCLGIVLFKKFQNIRLAVYIWFGAIIAYFIVGNAVSSFFQNLGFDDRLGNYIADSERYATTAKSGFRIDFLIYSAMPVWMAWYSAVKRKTTDRTYNIIACTYIYANAVWILLMDAAFSNRFAYLSWFMYPFVLVYPALKFNLWGNRQGAKASSIIMLNCLFTVFMEFIYYGLLR